MSTGGHWSVHEPTQADRDGLAESASERYSVQPRPSITTVPSLAVLLAVRMVRSGALIWVAGAAPDAPVGVGALHAAMATASSATGRTRRRCTVTSGGAERRYGWRHGRGPGRVHPDVMVASAARVWLTPRRSACWPGARRRAGGLASPT